MGLADAIASGDSPTLKRRSKKAAPPPAPVTPSTTPDQVLARSRTPSAVPASQTSSRSGRPRAPKPKRPEPALQTYKPPKRVEDKIQSELAKLDTPKATKAAAKPVVVKPRLEAPVKAKPNRTLVAPKVARRAVQELPKPVRQQQAQKLENRSQKAQKVKDSFDRLGATKPEKAIRKARNLARQAKIYNQLTSDDEGTSTLNPRQQRYYDRLRSEDRLEDLADAKVDRWWQGAKEVSGLKGPAPEVKWDVDLEDADVRGTDESGARAVVTGKREIKTALPAGSLAPPLKVGFTEGREEIQKGNRKTFLHEFAHIGQRRAHGASENDAQSRQREGRAERFANLASKRMGKPIDRDDFSEAYDKFRRQSRKRGETPEKILEGQFREERKRPRVKAKKPEAEPKTRVPKIVPQEYRRDVAKAAKQNGVRPELLAAQLQQESGFDPNAGSPMGAKGIAQFMDGTAASVGLSDPYDPHASIAAQGRLMGSLLAKYGGNESLALAAYNAGEGAVAEHGGIPPYAETQAYVKNILAAAGKGVSVKPPPKKTVTRYKAILDEAKKISSAQLPYVYGGAHVAGKIPGPRKVSGYDCSSFVSKVLQSAGVKLPGALVSGDLATTPLLKDGPGAVTIYANAGHTFMRIGDKFYGTSQSNPQGGAGLIEEGYDASYLSQYTVRHVPGLNAEVARRMGIRIPAGSAGISMSADGTTATVTDGVQQDAPGPSDKPILSDRLKRKRVRRKAAQKRRRQAARVRISSPRQLDPRDYRIDSDRESFSEYVKSRPVKLGLK